jgi:response regulator RpfG family c-di-GMP phosphodiesterase
MTGVEFLSRVKELYPDTIRMVLSGYTELNSITDAINQGAVYRFLTKPWDDQLLRANISEAFRRYRMAYEAQREVKDANAELSRLNQQLQALLDETSKVARNREVSLGVAHESLQNTPFAVLGLDVDGMVAFSNRAAEHLLGNGIPLLGSAAADTLPPALVACLHEGPHRKVEIDGRRYDVSSTTMGSSSQSQGTLLFLTPPGRTQ